MNPVSVYPAIAVLALALAAAHFLGNKARETPEQGRYASIDGLRGYLALFVFLHHSAIWLYYPRSGEWLLPPSNLYIHFGQSAVAMFFMITGFLFWSKVMASRTKPIDWTRLFISRLLRLTPLYLFAIALLLAMVAWLSGFTLIDSPAQLAKGVAQWVSFTFFDAPDLNGVPGTSRILANVTWSLAYEWFFYLSLPLLAIFFRMPPRQYLLLSGAGLLAAVYAGMGDYLVLSWFGCGILAAFFVKSELCSLAVRKSAGLVAIGCLAAAVSWSGFGFSLKPLPLIALAFTIIAGGNSLFGLLTNRASRTLGRISYSMYLLHGVVLFTVFEVILGPASASRLSPAEHWSIVLVCTPVLVAMSFFTYRMIEWPAMKKTGALTAWLHERWGSQRAAGTAVSPDIK